MADPKYADLPGIAHDEPDVYETNELPESDQQPSESFLIDENSDSIEPLNININEAYDKFKNKSFKTSRSGPELGFWQLMLENGRKETPIEKYQRLKLEFNELIEEVDKLQKINKDGVENRENLVDLQQVDLSIKKLNELKLEDSLGSEVLNKLSDPQGVQLSRLLSQLDQINQPTQGSTTQEKPQKPTIEQEQDNLTYKFSYRPQQGNLQQTARLAELENRLKKLETIIGIDSQKLQRLSSLNAKSTVMETVEHLSATASLLESSQLDHIEGRLNALGQKMDSITSKKQQLQQLDTENTTNNQEINAKIEELYNLVKNPEFAQHRQLCPDLINRLTILSDLHKKSADFVSDLTHLDNLQTNLKETVENNKQLLETVKSSVSDNFEGIKQSIVGLEDRIAKLQQLKAKK